MNEHIVVLLSTYFGEKYIRQQLDCIIEQDFPGQITVVIRDDGSRDNTCAIIRQMELPENRQIILHECANAGPQRSFLELIRLAPEADYYFFADQDDVWDLDKLRLGAEQLRPMGDTPAAQGANFRLSDMDLNIYDPAAIKEPPRFTPLSTLFYNKIPGCCMSFNRALMALCKQLQLPNVMMHDSMVLCLAAAVGTVLYDPESRIIHRIHRDNVVGDGHKKIVLHKWIPEKLKLVLKKEDYDVSQMAAEFLRVAGDRMHPPYREDLILLRDFKKSLGNTFALLRHPDTKGKWTDRTVMSIRSKILLHIF